MQMMKPSPAHFADEGFSGKNIDTMTFYNKLLKLAPMLAIISMASMVGAKEVARFSMELEDGKVTESVSGTSFDVKGVFAPENVAGASGDALRFDGYSTYIEAEIGEVIPEGTKQMTASVWMAVETYPIVEIDVNTTEQVAIASCLDDNAKKGFGFFLGFDGKYSFKTYLGGWPLELKVDTPMARYEWVNLSAVIDCDARTATLYNNGEVVASGKASGSLNAAHTMLRIGRSFQERYAGPFCLTSFNGLVDELTVWDEALTLDKIAAFTAENPADLTIPVSRFEGDVLRPTLHGMPGANWTNETHGMTYSDGRFHLFFQKNANGPYMARLHWGHLSSTNLYDWKEEPIAIAPGNNYDIKGCWSGTVFSDNEITGGKPAILYTGVDYVKAVIAQANSLDDDLIFWEKSARNPIISGRPSGLSDDFRDPYFFRSESGAYIIVGSSKNGIGTTTLHEYNPSSQTWSNDGRTFFTGTSAASCGTFWEMPTITKMGDKWLFTATPQNTSKGVATLYWTGNINSDGTFNPDKTTPAEVELPGFARDGYGLLSPTIYQHDGKTIALGIVPDKLPSHDNYELGYAHTYSLPREWSLDSEGRLCQKPYSGLTAMRDGNGYSKNSFTLNGSENINGIDGRCVELLGEFTVTDGQYGFTLLDDGQSSLKVYYDGSANEIVVDARGLDRRINDSNTFDGLYRSVLPQTLTKGSTLKLNVYFDHSILDIFINDTWASSVRVFANEKSIENTTVFSTSEVEVNNVYGWNLKTGSSDSVGQIYEGNNGEIFSSGSDLYYSGISCPALLTVYNTTGAAVMNTMLTDNSGVVSTRLSGLHIVHINDGTNSMARKILFN